MGGTMATANNDLLNLVNASGFLFQLKVEQEITASATQHGKAVLAREHRWVHPLTRQEGFVDLITSAGTNGKIVIECKRVREAQWVFLVPEGSAQTSNVRVLWTKRFSPDRQGAAWDEFSLQKASLESQFCIVRGQADRDQPMLERVAGFLLNSVEAFADEELSFERPVGGTGLRFYFPAVVTSAKLYACRFRPDKIDLISGELKTASFEEIRFIRFTKSMSTTLKSSQAPAQVTDSAIESQRTVFVVSAENLVPFLTGGWEFAPPLTGRWPWEMPRWEARADAPVSA